jgi:hypothetical protein
MSEEINGKQLADALAQEPSPDQRAAMTAAAQAMGQQLAAWMTPIIEAGVRGVMYTLPHIPPRLIAVHACRCLGSFIGRAFHGNLADVLSIRRECREAFIKALGEAPPPPPGPAHETPMMTRPKSN